MRVLDSTDPCSQRNLPSTVCGDASVGGTELGGCLVKAMYGTRQAASAWREEVEKAMRQVSLHPGVSSPCVFLRSDVGMGRMDSHHHVH